MKDGYLQIVLQAVAEKIDRLHGEVFVRDMEIENLKKEIESLKAENERIAADRDFFRDRFGKQPLNEEKEEADNA